MLQLLFLIVGDLYYSFFHCFHAFLPKCVLKLQLQMQPLDFWLFLISFKQFSLHFGIAKLLISYEIHTVKSKKTAKNGREEAR